jgi:Domain of unknown function (DUF6285)
VQFVPEAADLLGAIGRLLDEKVLGTVPPDLQHQVRVAAHLSTLLEREARLGPGNTAREDELIAGLLGERHADPQAALAARIRDGDDPAFEAAAWVAIVEITRNDLAVAKPGHDRWEGR